MGEKQAAKIEELQNLLDEATDDAAFAQGEVERYESENDDLRDRVSDLESDLDDARYDLVDAERDYQSMQDRADDLEQRAVDAESQIADLEGKIGDLEYDLVEERERAAYLEGQLDDAKADIEGLVGELVTWSTWMAEISATIAANLTYPDGDPRVVDGLVAEPSDVCAVLCDLLGEKASLGLLVSEFVIGLATLGDTLLGLANEGDPQDA